MKKITIRTVMIIGIIFMGFYVLLGFINIYFGLTEPKGYEELFGMNATGLHWQFLSFRNYFLWQGLNILTGVLYILLSILCYRNQKKFLLILIILTDIIILILLFRFCYLLRQSGYDHYPGFDPYFF